MILIQTTLPKKQAKKIAKNLIIHKLAFCVQLLPIESYYYWQDQLSSSKEVLLFIKTHKKNLVVNFLKEQHPYDVPEIVFLTLKSTPEYLDWSRCEY